MTTKKPAASYHPCPIKASSVFAPQPPPIPMYYARNPVRLTFEDADWGTLTDSEDSGSEQGLSSCSLVPTRPLIRPKPAEVSIRDLGKPPASALGALGTAADVKHYEGNVSADQSQRSTPAPPVVTHKDVPHPAQMPKTSCLLSCSKVKPSHVVDTNEQRQSVPRAASILPKNATRNLPPVFSESDDECDDPLAARLAIGGQPQKQNGSLEPGYTLEVGICARSDSDTHPGEIWAMLIAERAS